MAKTYDIQALRQKVLAADDIQYDEVYIEEWDATLPVATLSASDMKKVMKSQDDTVRMMILAVLYGCKTPDGQTVFKPEDLAQFEHNKGFGPITKIAEKVLDLSGFDDKAVKEAKNN